MVYPEFLTSMHEYIPYCAFIMAAFSALRLAKFNLDERQTTSFIGLPTPANALFWGSLIVGGQQILTSSPYMVLAILALVLVSSYLLIAELPLFALKFKHWGWKGNEVKYIFIATSAVFLIALQVSAFALIIMWYVILSILTNKK
jgi:CDP-diacylglycerol--serine O-phosphatidyltransferase